MIRILKHASIDDAIGILGEEKVFTPEQSIQIFGCGEQMNASINYLESELINCARENEEGKANWCLFTNSGLSPKQIHGKNGKLSEYFPGLKIDYPYPVHTIQEMWLNRCQPTGMFLINAKSNIKPCSYLMQNQQLAGLGTNYQRVPPVMLVEIALAWQYLYQMNILSDQIFMTDEELQYDNLMSVSALKDGSVKVGNIPRCGWATTMILTKPRENF